MTSLCVGLFLSLVAAAAAGGGRVVCRQLEQCDADIAMLVDKSGSITAPEDGGAPGNWRILKDFIYQIMRQTNYGSSASGVKYSVLFFANQANLKVKFNECSDIPCARTIIESLGGPGGRTNTNAALQTARDVIFSAANGDRPDAPNIIILLTDGKPNPPGGPRPAELEQIVRSIKDRNTRIVGIGVGTGVDDDIMRSLVTEPASENYFQIRDFASIAQEIDTIIQRACTVCEEEEEECWSDWSQWSSCDVTCGRGNERRTRRAAEGRSCPGQSEETRQCNLAPCECWRDWSDWSACDVTCDGGTSRRSRRPRGERRCEGNAEETRTCNTNPCEGCDPNTIDFRRAALRVKGYDKFEHDWIRGKWYISRWYLPQSKTVSDERYDWVSIVTGREGFDDRWFTNHYSRNKTTGCCNDVLRDRILVRKSKGVYDWNKGDSTDRLIFPYSNEVFLMEVICIGMNKEENNCEDYNVLLWSSCPKPRPQDIAKAVSILKEICYPDMKRFLCGKHKKDCSKQQMDHGYMDDDHDHYHYHGEMRHHHDYDDYDMRHGYDDYEDYDMWMRRRYGDDRRGRRRYDDDDDDMMRGKGKGGCGMDHDDEYEMKRRKPCH